MRIYLLGFMGAGKTTVGRLLGHRLGYPFVDLDLEIEQAAGRSVRDLFESEGEAGFRVRERAALRATLQLENAVVATGGGTPLAEENHRVLATQGVTVWLNPPFSVIVRRIGARGKGDRPLFRDEAQALDLYRERLPAYRRADLVVDVAAGELPSEVAARIALLVAGRACAT